MPIAERVTAMLSQKPVERKFPKVPFEMIYAYFFNLRKTVGDRLSGWTEVLQVKPSSSTSCAIGLCKALRYVFITFGVPEEVSSGGAQNL